MDVLLNRLFCWTARVLPCAVLLMVSAPAWAQEVAKAKKVNSLGGVLLGIVLALAVLAVSFLSPRRGHQD
ncbi:MAG: hypothetical protein V3V20_07530 [Algisphaera sp.]